MRLSDDYEEDSKLSPTLLTALMAVTLVIGIILAVVLLANGNQNKKSGGSSAGQTTELDTNTDLYDQNQAAQNTAGTSQASSASATEYPDLEDVISGSTLTPDDLDFWDMYPPEPSGATKPDAPLPDTESGEEEEVDDPAKDGKHTLLTNADGTEEWVLISPYLPKHDYDFTKLVCQDNLMKYYEDGKQVSFMGVDISKYQDYVDFNKLKKAGIDFVMLRAGARGYGSGQLVPDEYFADNLKRATDAGLQVGAYFFSQATTEEEAVEEALMVIESLGEYKITYPIAYDMESIPNDTARIDSLSKADKTTMAKTFMDFVQAAGYKALLYGDKEWLIREIDLSKLTNYDVWLAQPGDIPDYPYKFTMWQYSTNATIDGIAGYADLDICFIDYTEK